MRKIDLIIENIRDGYMINLLEEGEVSELEALKTKKFLNEALGRIRGMLVEEGALDAVKEHLKNNWGKYLAGLGAAGVGALTNQVYNHGVDVGGEDNFVDALKAGAQDYYSKIKAGAEDLADEATAKVTGAAGAIAQGAKDLYAKGITAAGEHGVDLAIPDNAKAAFEAIKNNPNISDEEKSTLLQRLVKANM